MNRAATIHPRTRHSSEREGAASCETAPRMNAGQDCDPALYHQIGHSFSSFESPKVSLCELRVKLMLIGLPPVLSKFSLKATT